MRRNYSAFTLFAPFGKSKAPAGNLGLTAIDENCAVRELPSGMWKTWRTGQIARLPEIHTSMLLSCFRTSAGDLGIARNKVAT